MKIGGYELSTNTIVPFAYARHTATSGFRIGGLPPTTATPRFAERPQKYFATVELAEGLAITIFYSLTAFGDVDDNHVILNANQPLYGSSLIHAVVHPVSPPFAESEIAAEVSCHAIECGAVQPDQLEVDSPEMPDSVSKIGGRPFAEDEASTGSAFAELAEQGYVQLVQFYSPNPDEMEYVVDFPWDPGWLHWFVKGDSPERWEFAFVIQN
ncbi:hypothetical protein [Blastopirellula marina]|uniref:DUF1963 domain-containing protein n=1 Tax=Blastopirellula marina TaxID=124 RepID=A0A2S8GFK3_9BACT|nr:hypothetical protein [Blastopirellula marina]PQO43238.1 hypothetical protein C5Y93_26430 [Blastopirellula marina]